jgi:pimeloyl-ACP methyl ester carboxylesterase
MPFVDIEGINTHYEVAGSGPPLLLVEPMGFDASLSRRWADRAWKGFQPLKSLPRDFQLIAYDRRESGKSGGRVEPLGWALSARHAVGLLDHLGVEKPVILGGCIGCSVAVALAANFPQRCRALLLHWPVGGFHWLRRARASFDRHIAFAREHGLAAVAERAKQSNLFWREPEAGPWSSVIACDDAFAQNYMRHDLDRYLQIVVQSRDNLFPDTMPAGASGEQLMTLNVPTFIMPGDDASHALSCAHALREMIPRAKLAALPPPQQNAQTIAKWIAESGAACGIGRSIAA